MIENSFRATVDSYDDIIDSVEAIEITEEEQIAKLKARLRLFDGTILWVREITIKEKLESYDITTSGYADNDVTSTI